MVCAAGSMPGDLHKLWRTRDPKGYHVEYGYSCMGYEIAGGLGVKMAVRPDRDVFVMVGDGSYLMMAQEMVTAVQEGIKIIVVLVQNHGFASIGALSEIARLAAVRHPLPLPRPSTGARRRHAAGRPGRQRREPRRRRAARDGPSTSSGRRSSRRRPSDATAGRATSRPTRWSRRRQPSRWWDVPVAETSAWNRRTQARERPTTSTSSQRSRAPVSSTGGARTATRPTRRGRA